MGGEKEQHNNIDKRREKKDELIGAFIKWVGFEIREDQEEKNERRWESGVPFCCSLCTQ